MRHTTTATLAVAMAGLLALTGCSSSSGAKPAATASSPVPTVPVRDQFLQAINAANIESWGKVGPSDDELAAFPDQWCTQLAYGHSVKWMFDTSQGDLYPIGQDWGTTKTDAYKVLVMAVGFYCPERKKQVLDELRASGDY